mgnify:CR=1 FL=1
MEIFARDYKSEPFWWEKTSRPVIEAKEIPQVVDVAIVGSGYTGLCAAIVLARAGREVTIFDSENAGWGCSSRNGGQVSTSIKPSYKALRTKFGKTDAFNIIKEGQASLQWLKEFILNEQIECSFNVPGRFYAAHNKKEFENLEKEISEQPPGLEVQSTLVPPAEQRRELGTDIYHGGIIFDSHASLDPALFHQGLLDRALDAGVSIVPYCKVLELSGTSPDFRVLTERGELQAQEVIVATNGYTGRLTPWLARRVIPIGSYMIATEPIEKSLMDRLMPSNRVISDTRKVVYYYRPAPDRSRIIFGGRVTTGEVDVRQSGSLLRSDLIGIFPELLNIKITHSWMGFVAYTFDELPHIGNHKGIYYAMGCCGSGVGMASYLGTRVGQQLLGIAEGKTALDKISFKTRPLYTGSPWFLPVAVAYYRWRDGTGK